MKDNTITTDYLIKFIKENKDFFKNMFHITEIGVFGSYAREEQNPESDIDIIIEFEEDTNNIYEIKNALKDFFKKNLNKDTDIARKKYIKKRIKEQILQETIYV